MDAPKSQVESCYLMSLRLVLLLLTALLVITLVCLSLIQYSSELWPAILRVRRWTVLFDQMSTSLHSNTLGSSDLSGRGASLLVLQLELHMVSHSTAISACGAEGAGVALMGLQRWWLCGDRRGMCPHWGRYR